MIYLRAILQLQSGHHKKEVEMGKDSFAAFVGGEIQNVLGFVLWGVQEKDLKLNFAAH